MKIMVETFFLDHITDSHCWMEYCLDMFFRGNLTHPVQSVSDILHQIRYTNPSSKIKIQIEENLFIKINLSIKS